MTQNPRSIVIGSSLERASDAVLATALELSRATGAELHLVHAFPMPAIYSGAAMTGGALLPTTDYELDRCRGALDRQLERVGASRDALKSLVLEPGPAHLWLHETAEAKSADLVVVGAHEGSALTSVLGSTADRVLRKASCPVLVVRDRLRLPIETVMAPTDLSPLARTSLERGMGWLADLGQEAPPQVTLLFVLSRVDREGSVHFTPEQVDRFAQLELERFATKLPLGERAPKLRVRVGAARQEITADLEESPADLVIVGTHGRSGFERLMLGSIAEGIVRRAPGNVLVVPPTPAEAARAAAAGG